jgi:hypothetical protein
MTYLKGQYEIKDCADRILATFAQGYEIPSNRVGTFIFPIVPFKKRTGRLLRFGKEAFAVGDYRRAYGIRHRPTDAPTRRK